jgi:hypothetical protein
MMTQFVVWQLRGVRYLCLAIPGSVFVDQIKRIP